MTQWIEKTVAELKTNDVFRFPDEPVDCIHRVSSRWDEDGWVRFTSHLVISNRPEGLSIQRPDNRVLVLE